MADDPTAPGTTRTGSMTFSSDGHGYLMAVTRRGAWRVPIPGSGSLVIGRDPACDVRLEESAVSRKHARIELRDGHVWVEDLGSHNGTLLGGKPIDRPRVLRSGDTVAVGGASLVACLNARSRAAVRLLDPDEMREQIQREVDRAYRHDRPMALVCTTMDRRQSVAAAALLPSALRVIELAGHLDDDHLFVLCPELPSAAAADRCRQLVDALIPAATEVRAGIARVPGDAIDAESLIAAARDALAEPGGARVSAAGSGGESIRLGELELVVADPAMRELYGLVERLGPSELSVLICGETGVGKELAARALHASSERPTGPFVAVNCAALPEPLAESELFGYRRGAFSGADRDKPGQFEAASGGTLFLDEVGELSPALQSKLLRVVETGSVTPLGATEPARVDVRIVSATNRDIAAEIDAGRFRADLFYRLGAATIVIPPLRDRPRDLPLLARRLLARACADRGRPCAEISDPAMARLAAHTFPGNVRELANAMAYAAALVEDDEPIGPHHLPPTLHGLAPRPSHQDDPHPPVFRPVADELAELEARRMREALEATGGNQLRAAELIGMPRRTFTKKMTRYHLRERARDA